MFFAFLFFDLILHSELSGWIEIYMYVNFVVYCGHVVCVRVDMRYKCGMGLLPCHRVTCRACILATTEMICKLITCTGVYCRATSVNNVYFEVVMIFTCRIIFSEASFFM